MIIIIRIVLNYIKNISIRSPGNGGSIVGIPIDHRIMTIIDKLIERAF